MGGIVWPDPRRVNGFSRRALAPASVQDSSGIRSDEVGSASRPRELSFERAIARAVCTVVRGVSGTVARVCGSGEFGTGRWPASTSVGNEKVNHVPWACEDSTHTLPPRCRTHWSTMDRPRPVLRTPPVRSPLRV
jgi:hypothetical protein